MRKSDCGKYEKIRIESVVIVSKIFFKVKICFSEKTIVVKCGKLTKNLNAAREWVSLR